MNNTSTTTATGYGCRSFIIQCLFSTAERYAIVVSVLIIAVASFIGNVLVCCAFFADNKKGSALTLSSLHLAVANLLITIFWGPIITIYLYIMGEWTLGPVMCKLMAFMQNTGVIASLLHLLVVTVEKFVAVCFPFTFRRTNKVAYRCSLALVWLISMSDSAYYIQFKQLRSFGGINYCMEKWPDDKTFRIITLAKTLFFFLTLFAIMILLGWTIFELRFGKGNFRPETNGRDEPSWSRKRSRQARAVKILVVMLLSVLVCWTPFHSLSLVDIADGMDAVPVRDQLIVFTVSLVLFFSVCTIHPIIFLFINRQGADSMRQGLSNIYYSRKEGDRRARSSSALDSTNIITSRRLSVALPLNRIVHAVSDSPRLSTVHCPL